MKVRNYIWTYLQAIGLRPIPWDKAVKMTGDPAPFVGDILEAGFRCAQAVLVVLTGDDLARVKTRYGSERLTAQPRANVLFEAGMALGRFQKRTVFVQVGDIRSFSDFAGRHVVRLDDNPNALKELADRLKSAGCEVATDITVPLDAAPASLIEHDRHRSIEIPRLLLYGCLTVSILLGLAVGLFGNSISAQLATIVVSGVINGPNPLDIYFVAGHANKIVPGEVNTQYRQQDEKVKVLFVEGSTVVEDEDVQIDHHRLMLPPYPRVVPSVISDEEAQRFRNGRK